jgi:hypothetical protein
MSSASPFQAVLEPTQAIKGTEVWDFAEECLQRTAAALHECRAATPAEISQGIGTAREFHAAQKPADLLEVLARIQGHGEEHLSPAILELGNKVSGTLLPYAPIIPFAGKLIAPSAFYDSFEHIHRTARALLSPVIYAEDTDSVGTASVNPIASAMLADEIRANVFKRFGIRPFVTIARLDYESWTFLSRKHFEL